jgi:hypothetical protein
VLGVVLGLGVGLLPVRTIRKPTTAASTSEYPSRSYQAPRA